jgi:hypothetical protein
VSWLPSASRPSLHEAEPPERATAPGTPQGRGRATVKSGVADDFPVFTATPANSLVFSTETQFVVHEPCQSCRGTGADQDPSKVFNTSLNLEERRCTICHGKGHFQKYITLDQLYFMFFPHMVKGFMKHLPDILEQAKVAVVQAIMES